MAIWQSSLYTTQVPALGKSEAVQYPLAKNARGKLRIVQIPYTLVGTEAANDLIYLTMLQPGDRVLPQYSKVTGQNPGTTLTIQIGDSVTVNRYSGTLTLSGAATDLFFSSTPGTTLYAPTDITLPAYLPASPPQPVPPPNPLDQTIVICKVISAASLTAAQIILFSLAVVGE